MKTNAVVKEVRATRKKISVDHGNSLTQLVNRYQRMERSFDGKMRSSAMLRKAS